MFLLKAEAVAVPGHEDRDTCWVGKLCGERSRPPGMQEAKRKPSLGHLSNKPTLESPF